MSKEAIIDVKKENREHFINSFEKKGFVIEKRFSKEELIESVLPITLDFGTKEIGRMGNVTCTCIASKHRMIMQEYEFWKTLDIDYKRLSDTPNVFVVDYKADNSIEYEEIKRYLSNKKYEVSRFNRLGSIPHGSWLFVNLDNKTYAQGHIGVQFAKPYYDHAVTVYEFMHINERYELIKNIEDAEIKSIFEKYKGKKILEF